MESSCETSRAVHIILPVPQIYLLILDVPCHVALREDVSFGDIATGNLGVKGLVNKAKIQFGLWLRLNHIFSSRMINSVQSLSL